MGRSSKKLVKFNFLSNDKVETKTENYWFMKCKFCGKEDVSYFYLFDVTLGKCTF